MVYDNKKKAGALVIFACVQFLLFLVIAQALRPDFSIHHNYISDLGVGPYAYIFNVSVFLLGLAMVAAAYFVHRAYNYRLLFILLVITGIGAMGVGLFPEDHIVPHSIAALIAFFFWPLSAIVSYKIVEPPFSYCSVMLGVLSLVALVLFVATVYLGLGPGGMERLIAYPTILWGVGFGGSLISSQ